MNPALLGALLCAVVGLLALGLRRSRRGARPAHVGVLSMALYVPPASVRQAGLAEHDGVPAGKYLRGLGQESMAVASDREDVASLCLTAVARLLERAGVSPSEVGRLEVGTETLIDKCKSTKTLLMSLFEGSGNSDVEGATVINACYGGTAALFNAAAWVESSAWTGKYAVVVAADIAIYAPGPARPTGGCGAVAMLVGPDAPLALEPLRTTHAANTWDFFKPHLASEFPTVDGPSSLQCYLSALDSCYERFVGRGGPRLSSAGVGAMLFHSPYYRLVQKAALRLLFHDVRARGRGALPEGLQRWREQAPEENLADRELYLALKEHDEAHGDVVQRRIEDGAQLGKAIGNCYTASLYAGLASLVSRRRQRLEGQRVLLFSFGSGALGSLFSLHARRGGGRFSLEAMARALDVEGELAGRREIDPREFERRLEARERNAARTPPFAPQDDPEELPPGAFFLEQVHASGERTYGRRGS